MEKSRSRFVFGDLPLDLYDNILCLLEISDLIRFSLASKSCQNLCLSLQSLLIRVGLDDAGELPVVCSSITKFIERRSVLGKNTRIFKVFSSSTDYKMSIIINMWLLSTSNPNLEHIAIYFGDNASDQLIMLPDCLYGLRSLFIRADNFVFLRLGLYHTKRVLDIRDLVLNSVKITFGSEYYRRHFLLSVVNLDLCKVRGLGDNVTIRSKFMETIKIHDIQDVSSLSIYAENLNYLAIYRTPTDKMSLEVSAPNLEWLMMVGYVPVRCSFIGSFPRISEMVIDVVERQEYHTMLENDKAKWLNELHRFLHAVRSVKVVITTIETIKFFHKLDCLPFPSNADVSSLRIVTHRFEDNDVPAVEAFLKRCPNLTEFYFHGYCAFTPSFAEDHNPTDSSTTFDVKYWESRKLEFVHNLRLVDINIVWGRNETELLKYLVKHGGKLEYAKVVHSSSSLSSEKMREIEQDKNPYSLIAYYLEKNNFSPISAKSPEWSDFASNSDQTFF